MTYLIIILLVLLSGLFSGLTLGLLQLSKSELQRKINIGDKKAKKVYSIRKNGSLLLTTLLIGNVLVNSILSVFLSSIGTGIMAVILSTVLITIFGEILPQATISRYALNFGSKTVWLVKIFIAIFWIIAKPISLGIDLLLGEEGKYTLKKKELAEIVKEQEDNNESPLDEDEERIMLGALSFSDKSAKNIMTPKSVVFSLDSTKKFNKKMLLKIKNKGFSRVPVYSNDNDHIISILYTKNLIDFDITSDKKVCDLSVNSLLRVDESIKLDKLFNVFIKRKRHIAIIYDEYGTYSGIVTLEDIIEEILSVEIVDEQDTIEDMQKHAKKQIDTKLLIK